MRPRAGFPPEGSTWKGSASNTWWLASVRSLLASVSHWLSARGHDQFQVSWWPEAALGPLPYRPHQHGGLLCQIQQGEHLPARWKSGSSVMSLWKSHLVTFASNLRLQARHRSRLHSRREVCTRAWGRVGVVGVALESVCPSVSEVGTSVLVE